MGLGLIGSQAHRDMLGLFGPGPLGPGAVGPLGPLGPIARFVVISMPTLAVAIRPRFVVILLVWGPGTRFHII